MAWAEQFIINEFHKLYYEGLAANGRLFENTTWMGVSCLKCPLDLWIYQEILQELKPDLIIETGTYHGGSALYLAHLCDALGHGHIASIDVLDIPRPAHHRVTYLNGSSTDPLIAQAALSCASAKETVLVILDSDHSEAHVLEELRLYAPMVSEGSYLIVEDTNVNKHPVRPEFGPGPYEAVTKFLAESSRFVPDIEKEKFLLTFNPRGYLKKISESEAGNDIIEVSNESEKVPELIQVAQNAYQRELKRLTEELDRRTEELDRRTEELKVTQNAYQRELKRLMEELDRRTEELNCVQTELNYVNADLNRLRSHWLIKPALRLRRFLLGNRQ